jgi:hypothetical protein
VWPFLLCILFVTYGITTDDEGCMSRDEDISLKEEVLDSVNGPGGGDYTINFGIKYKWNFKYKNYLIVPYYFNESTVKSDEQKKPFLSIMSELKSRTCIYFWRVSPKYGGKALVLSVRPRCAYTGTGGRLYARDHDLHINRPLLEMFNYICDETPQRTYDRYYGLLRHEFLHVFGLMHTQNRWDRDDHVNVTKAHIKPNKLAQFKKCITCKYFTDIPYECHSIMHYDENAMSKQIRGLKTITAVDSKCDFSKQSNYLTDNDWKLLHRAAQCPGEGPKADY